MITPERLLAAGTMTDPTPPKLLVDGLAVRYESAAPGQYACQGIEFRLEPGDRLTVLGPTGCGKSTMLKAIAGYLPIAAGRVEVSGRAVSAPGQDRFVMFQEFDQLFPWQTIRSNIVYALKARTKRRSEKMRASEMSTRADELLSMVGLAGRGDLYPGECSGGMKQRVALARALAISPEVLLLDEPFGALDAQTRRRLQEQLLGLCERLDTTILFVTHDIPEAVMIGNRIMMMSAAGRVTNIYEAENHDQVALEEHLRDELRSNQTRGPGAQNPTDASAPPKRAGLLGWAKGWR
ncbi:ABC transporter ATP-binding protein [Luedemannella helvata]